MAILSAFNRDKNVAKEKSCGRAIASIAILLSVALAGPDAASALSTEQCGGDGGFAVRVTVDGVRSARGSISIAVYGDRPEDFLAKGKKLRKLRLAAGSGVVRGCLSLPGPGTYALTAYHDEDGDGHFTKNFLGLPVEGFAVSNGNASLLGVPSFADAAVAIFEAHSQITLKMQYP